MPDDYLVSGPSGGTSDFAPETIQAAAPGQPYACFVRSDARVGFMALPDGVTALLMLAYSIQNIVGRAFPGAKITTSVDQKRQAIVDSRPADVDDSAARSDGDSSLASPSSRRSRTTRSRRSASGIAAEARPVDRRPGNLLSSCHLRR